MSVTNVLALATRLRGMPGDEILAAFRARELAAGGITDFFDLAEALLSRESIDRSLARLDRSTLSILSTASALTREGAEPTLTAIVARQSELSGTDAASLDGDDRARMRTVSELLLTAPSDSSVAPYDAVREVLESWPESGLPTEAQLAASTPPASLDAVDLDSDGSIDRLASERAFSSTSAIAELLSELTEQPARELSRGGLALPDSKRLAAAMSLELDAVPAVISIAERAGLVTRESNLWLVTEESAAWLHGSSVARWARLASAWLADLSPDVRRILRSRSRARWGDGLLAYVDWVYPVGGDWLRQRIGVVTRDAEVLGITADRSASGPGSALLERGPDAAADSIRSLFPAEVDRVYLQHDLSIVSPGPLAPAVDARLRSMADVESRGLAATYRVSSSSLNRAIAGGESADTVREFLRSISLTGIPQPLEYLVHDVSSRYGLLRVGAERGDATAAKSYVRSDDEHLLSTVEIDQSLGAVGLVRAGPHRLVSRFERDVVFWALTDSRYPAAAEDDDGRVVPLHRGRVGRSRVAAESDPAEALLDRLRSGGSTSPESTGEDWLARQLDIAIRGKVTLSVRVAMPNGTEVDYQLEPTGLSGGRLRARDPRADIERTLPLSSITAISGSDGAQ